MHKKTAQNLREQQVLRGFFWRFAERIGAQGVSFLVQLVLARLLLPEDYGTAALIAVITGILQVFVDSGMGNALIQKKEADEKDFSTVFCFNVGSCAALYVLLFVTAPLIARFYGRVEMAAMLRVAGLILPVAGVKNVQQAYVARQLLFRRFFAATLVGTVCSAVVGVGMALQGLGVWALIAQQLVNAAMDTAMLWMLAGWRSARKAKTERPQRHGFSCVPDGIVVDVRRARRCNGSRLCPSERHQKHQIREMIATGRQRAHGIIVRWFCKIGFYPDRFGALFGFGWKLLAASLLDTVYQNLRQLAIGRLYSPTELAFYNRGQQVPNLVSSNLNTSLGSVLLPVLSQAQEEPAEVKRMTRKTIRLSSWCVWPCLVGLAVVADPLVRLVLTEQWLPAVPYLRVFCFIYVLYPVHTANLNAMQAMGRSDLFFRLEVIKKAYGLTALLLTMQLGPMAMAWSLLGVNVVSLVVNWFPNRRLLSYSFGELLADVLPAAVTAGGIGMALMWLIAGDGVGGMRIL